MAGARSTRPVTWVEALLTRWASSRPGPLAGALVLLVLAVDLLLARLPWHIGSGGVIDWTGHLATSGTALLAAAGLGLRLPRRTVLIALASSVLIDLDHVGLYTGVPHVAAAGGRPFTHSVATVAVLLAAAGLTRHRRVLLPVAGGVLLHFLRDVATGPGLPLLWPADVAVKAPYTAYVAVLVGLAAVAALTERRAAAGAG